MNRIVKGALGAAATTAISALAAHGAAAQTGVGTDARWQPWLGCWQSAAAAAPAFGNERSTAPLVCVVPAGGTSVDVITVTDGKVGAREHVDASGARVASTQDGCEGTRTGHFSADARRVYLSSEYSCAGGARRASSGMLAMSAEGELLDVESVGVGEHRAVRALRYRPAAAPEGVADVATGAPSLGSAAGAARLAAAAPVTVADVRDVAHSVDAKVLEAWLIERKQHFDLDGRALLALADAGVPSSAIDVMVAVSYPEHFAVNPVPAADMLTGRTVYGTVGRDIYPNDGFNGAGGFYGWDGYSPFGNGYYTPYGYGYSPYGYNGYNGYGSLGGLYGWYPPGGTVIVVRNPDGSIPESNHGRVVKGRGYTRDDGSSNPPREPSGTSTTRASSPPPSQPASPPSSGTSTGRSAKPRGT